jgi:hypothetical protein
MAVIISSQGRTHVPRPLGTKMKTSPHSVHLVDEH